MSDALFRAKHRSDNLTTTDLRRAGYPIVHCCGSRVLPKLHELGWFISGETKTTEIDCGNWMHCGPSCCGPCPKCGDDPKLQSPRHQALVAPPIKISRNKAKSLLNAIMREVVQDV